MRAVTFPLVIALSAALAVPQLYATPAASNSHPVAEAQSLGPESPGISACSPICRSKRGAAWL